MHSTEMTLEDLKETISPFVAKGAEFLDGENPGWFSRINKDFLSFPSFTMCVLGQLYGDYFSALDAIGKSCNNWRWPHDHGFSLRPVHAFDGAYSAEQAWEVLVDLWIAEIVKREAAA